MAHSEQQHTDPADDRYEVISESDRNPGVRVVRVHRPDPTDATFLTATAKGLGVTLKHFFRNVKHAIPVIGKKNTIETIQYPEQTVDYPERNRGLHRLMLRDDGNVRCVACMCCPTACPANCITIVPAETERTDHGEVVEKYPAIFEIDELRCVVCGLCVEACPCDAIRMDTGVHAPPVEERGHAIENKDSMLARGIRSIATQGGEGPDWRDHE